MLQSGTGLIRIARNCWIEPDRVGDLSAVCAAVLASCPSDAVISSTTAARLHGLWLPSEPVQIHVATATPDRAARGMSRTRRSPFVAHRLRLDEEDVSQAHGLTVMSPARTWFDLATVLSLPDLVAAGDSVLRMGVAEDELARLLQRMAGRRGLQRARTALPMLDARSRSRAESHLRVAIWTPDLPRFEVNAPVYRAEGGWLAEPDLSLAEAKLALEYQGVDHAKVRRMRGDITRRRDLRAERWLTLDYGPAEVFGRPWTIAPEIRAELLERAPHLVVAERPARRRRPARPTRRVAS